MKSDREGEIVLVNVAQRDGGAKKRPVILLKELHAYGDFLVCGLRTQLHHEVPDFDEVIGPNDGDFASSHLKVVSLIRLGFLAVITKVQAQGAIGHISKERLQRLQTRLANFLLA
jgi:mRNA interferase MazF